MVMADALVATLFQYGAFDAGDVYQTELAVMAYAVGLLGLLLVKILAPGFYGKQDIKTPVKIAILVLILTQVFNLMLVPSLAHAGLALAIGLGACINALALYVGLRRRQLYVAQPGWWPFLGKLVLGLAVMAATLVFIAGDVNWTGLDIGIWQRAGWLALTLGAGLVSYLGTLWVLGMRVRDFRRAPER
jgi:putative peptidoglycan lipid II flippase